MAAVPVTQRHICAHIDTRLTKKSYEDIQQLWEAAQEGYVTSFPHLISKEHDYERILENLPKKVIFVSKKTMLVFVRTIGTGSFKRVTKALMWQQQGESIQKIFVAVATPRSKAGSTAHLLSEIKVVKAFDSPRLVSKPIHSFYLSESDPKTLHVISKLYLGNAENIFNKIINFYYIHLCNIINKNTHIF